MLIFVSEKNRPLLLAKGVCCEMGENANMFFYVLLDIFIKISINLLDFHLLHSHLCPSLFEALTYRIVPIGNARC